MISLRSYILQDEDNTDNIPVRIVGILVKEIGRVS